MPRRKIGTSLPVTVVATTGMAAAGGAGAAAAAGGTFRTYNKPPPPAAATTRTASPILRLRFTVVVSVVRQWPQGLAELPAGLALLDGFGPATGAGVLMPVPPSSVDPSGIPTLPIDDVGGRIDDGGWLSAQESGALPESPQASNSGG